jgi:hypothetical protein
MLDKALGAGPSINVGQPLGEPLFMECSAPTALSKGMFAPGVG